MTNNDDGNLGDPGVPGEEIPFEDFESGGGNNLGEMFRNNPLVKVGVVLGGFAAIIGGVILFGGSKEKVDPSIVSGSNVSQAPGDESGEVSEVYRDAVEQTNLEAVETAIKEGTSALPVPIAPPVGRLGMEDEKADIEDPLERWRRIQEERIRREQQTKEPLPKADPNAEAVNQLAESMSSQMQTILAGMKPVKPQSEDITGKDYLETLEKEKQEAAEAEAGMDADKKEPEIIDIIIPAGTIEYAQMMLEANSDVVGPIMAQLVSGPLAGARMLGTFENQEDYLVLRFTTIVIDGVSAGIDAVALNPETATIGMVTDIDHRYFSRVILPAAAAFVEGMGSAIAQTGTTTTIGAGGATTTDVPELDTKEEIFKGVEKMSEKLSEIIDENADDIEPLITVAAGTPMGILFLQPVTEETQ